MEERPATDTQGRLNDSHSAVMAVSFMTLAIVPKERAVVQSPACPSSSVEVSPGKIMCNILPQTNVETEEKPCMCRHGGWLHGDNSLCRLQSAQSEGTLIYKDGHACSPPKT